MKKAFNILNRQHDKRKIEDLDPSDVEEFDELLEEMESFEIGRENEPNTNESEVDTVQRTAIRTLPISAIEYQASTSQLAIAPKQTAANGLCSSLDSVEAEAGGSDDDDLIEIGSSGSYPIKTGVEPIQIDREFSKEYSYTVDVS